jgi:uncharacterized protein (DUF433 family)
MRYSHKILPPHCPSPKARQNPGGGWALIGFNPAFPWLGRQQKSGMGGAPRRGRLVFSRDELLEPSAGKAYNGGVKYANRITFDPEQCGGRPCIRHYRIRVKDVLDMLAGGASEAEILKEYDFLESEDIRACYEFAAERVDFPILVNI